MASEPISAATAAKLRTEGAIAERERIRQILDCPEAAAAPDQARHLAFRTAAAAADAIAHLRRAPRAEGTPAAAVASAPQVNAQSLYERRAAEAGHSR